MTDILVFRRVHDRLAPPSFDHIVGGDLQRQRHP
jgi:hypothetical protein